MKQLTNEGLRIELIKAIARAGSGNAFANEHGLAASYVNAVARGVWKPSMSIAVALGYQKKVVFEKIN